ncbi:hypothetical protein SUTMEG_09370 [Sutterella megalosphaeroides]|uniref:Uncharacterized protein n=1 Tax=Sutterella megalosphaeroides TaxID=2494234 RepID=A0A2Z6IED7_9BURK|nr:hypothetical protein SUTMEG_09370 [Sutterella megalosphaeroides]
MDMTDMTGKDVMLTLEEMAGISQVCEFYGGGIGGVYFPCEYVRMEVMCLACCIWFAMTWLTPKSYDVFTK